ncbi:MAG: sulfide/dihydroorotate dehydrogenase-like FAD/NAD-binding protein [Promethearchaeota archaeon]
MSRILSKIKLNEVIYQIDVEHPRIARKGKPGQFVILLLHSKGERIPLTLADQDAGKGYITLVFQVVGKTTLELSMLEEGDDIPVIVGPLGRPADVQRFGTVVLVGGGCGVGPVFAQAKAFKHTGNSVISIIGFRSKDYIFWEDRMRRVSNELIVCTDDGSYGFTGYTTDALAELINSGQVIDRVISIGPLVMMANTVKVTKPHGIKTIVSLNAIMVDGTGMCGSCRVSTSHGIKFSCVDGPDMDGFDIDFDELMSRNKRYKDEEQRSLAFFKERCKQGGKI